MDILLFHLEIVGLSALLVAFHASRERLGLYPLVMAVGLLLSMMLLGSQLGATVPTLFAGETFYTSQLHLALLLSIHVIIYALEGTRAARQMITSVAVMGGTLLLFRILLSFHLTGGSQALDPLTAQRWTAPDMLSGLISLIALVVDGFLIIVVYQGLNNLSERLPQVLALALALTTAMVADGLIYGGLSGTIALSGLGPHVLGKLTAGLAASLPMALYIRHQLTHHPERFKKGGLQGRRTFAIVDLQRELHSAREALARSQAEVEHVRSVFGRYVVPDVVDEILNDSEGLKLGGELREVTVVFSDIRGYSTLSETMAPEQIIELLNIYFGAMSELITAERGTIIEFEGDAILTVFGAPVHQDDHAERAVRTAIAMLHEVERLNARWDADGTSAHWNKVGLASFSIRVGIHSGPVVAGNVGSHSRTKYAVIGDTVNTAARVESLNKELHTELLLSEATVAHIDPERLGITLKDLGSHQVKGRREPVTVFSADKPR